MSKKCFFILLVINACVNASEQLPSLNQSVIFVNSFSFNNQFAPAAYRSLELPDFQSLIADQVSLLSADKIQTKLDILDKKAAVAIQQFKKADEDWRQGFNSNSSFDYTQYTQILVQLSLAKLKDEQVVLTRELNNLLGQMRENRSTVDSINQEFSSIIKKSEAELCFKFGNVDKIDFVKALQPEVQILFCKASAELYKAPQEIELLSNKLSMASEILIQRQTQLQQLEQVSKNYTDLSRTHSLSSDDKRLVEAINQTIKEDAALHQLQLTPEIKTLHAQGNIKVPNLENVMVNTFQKYLIERGVKVSIDQAALLKEHGANPKIAGYVEATLKSNAAALDMAQTGTAQEAIAAAKLTSVLEQATSMEIGFAKGLAYGTAGIAVTGVAIAAVPELGGALLLKFG